MIYKLLNSMEISVALSNASKVAPVTNVILLYFKITNLKRKVCNDLRLLEDG